MSDHMARSIANDKSDPANFPEDTDFRPCRECGDEIKIDPYNAKEVGVEEFEHCFEHMKTVEELKEECSYKIRDIVGLTKRIKELESRCIFKEDLLREARLGLITLCESIGRER